VVVSELGTDCALVGVGLQLLRGHCRNNIARWRSDAVFDRHSTGLQLASLRETKSNARASTTCEWSGVVYVVADVGYVEDAPFEPVASGQDDVFPVGWSKWATWTCDRVVDVMVAAGDMDGLPHNDQFQLGAEA
jgi:hypothetical protein